ncbi:MAG TPA: glycosyltransferase, partial [Terriglobales bacterium]
MNVTICIPTFRRPALLSALLRSLERLCFAKVREPRISIVVVDNDANGSAAHSLRTFDSSRFEIGYRIETQPGISYARNTCIRAAGPSDFIAFIDDDETASPTWLDELLNAQRAFDAPIVAGPIVPHYETQPPAWLITGGFHQRRRYATGTTVASTSAGNVLVARRVFERLTPPWFDLQFARSGGEDTHFFRRCATFGFPVTWANDAIAYEEIPDERSTPDYLLRRARDGGNHWTRVDLALQVPLYRLALRMAAGVARIAQGYASAALGPLLSPSQRLQNAMRAAEGVGNLSAFLGREF